MKRGFYTIMSAQFFSSLADNALFVTAVELLRANGSESFGKTHSVSSVLVFLEYVLLPEHSLKAVT